MGEKVSIRPSEMVEGGAVPVDQNLTWKEARFRLYDYNGKAPQTTAAMIKLVNDDGQEYEQAYSVADPQRFVPSADGKTLVAVGAAQALNKSSNFFLLMTSLVNAGFPENKLDGDISVLDGLYAHHIGVPEPKRAGLAQTTAPAGTTPREKVISVPDKVLRLPWEKAKGGKGGAAKPPAAGAAAPAGDVTKLAVEFVGKIVEEVGEITRQDLAVRAFADLAKDPNKDAIASAIFSPAMAGALLAAGFKIDGETISKP